MDGPPLLVELIVFTPDFSWSLCYMVLGKTQPQKLAIEVSIPSRLCTSYYFDTQVMWNFASHLQSSSCPRLEYTVNN